MTGYKMNRLPRQFPEISRRTFEILTPKTSTPKSPGVVGVNFLLIR